MPLLFPFIMPCRRWLVVEHSLTHSLIHSFEQSAQSSISQRNYQLVRLLQRTCLLTETSHPAPTLYTISEVADPQPLEISVSRIHILSAMLAIRDDSNYKLYQYTPQLVPAIVAAVLFVSGGIAHIIFLRRLHTNYFIPFVVGCFSEPCDC